MLRKGFEVAIDGDRDAAEAVKDRLEELDATEHLRTALVNSRVYGGGALLLGADDGASDLSRPLNEKAIRSFNFLTPLHRYELRALSYYADPFAKNYGLPATYELVPFYDPFGGAEKAKDRYVIHESRLLIFESVKVSRTQRVRNQGWGDSVYVRVFEVLRDFNMSWGAVANLLSDWAQGVYKINGLNEMILSENEEVIKARFAAMDLARSTVRSVVLDAGGGPNGAPAESFERQVSALTGTPEVMRELAIRLAAAARMPLNMLFGQSPSGLGATGQDAEEWFDDQVAAEQGKLLFKNLKRLLRLIMLAKDGPTKGKIPERWSLKFCPLAQLDDLEESQRRLNIGQADAIYLDRQVVTPEEIAASRFGTEEYSAETVVDMEAREAMAVDPAERLAPKPDPEPAPKAGAAP
jgi:phage-related protein (TIGR01555 family)